MPNLKKPPKTINKVPKPGTKPTKKLLPTPFKSNPPKNTPQYYQCLLTKAQANWYDPSTGKKKKITACCKECKFNAPKLSEIRKQEIGKLITSYQQVGVSLRKLLSPIK